MVAPTAQVGFDPQIEAEVAALDLPKISAKSTSTLRISKLPFATSKKADDELFLMDSYYKELIKKERAAFERILVSKLNVHERDVERRY